MRLTPVLRRFLVIIRDGNGRHKQAPTPAIHLAERL